MIPSIDLTSGEGWLRFGAEIVLQAMLVGVFIAIFYFTYGRVVERDAINNQVGEIVDSFTNNLQFVDTSSRDALGRTVASLPTTSPSLQAANAAAMARNKKTRRRAAIGVAVMVVVGFVALGGMALLNRRRPSSFTWKRLVVDTLIVLAFVALTEFLFSTFVMKKYRSVDSHEVDRTLVNQFISYGHSCSPQTALRRDGGNVNWVWA